MWKWLADNWMGLTALLLSFDAERRLYLSTDWGVDKTDGDGVDTAQQRVAHRTRHSGDADWRRYRRIPWSLQAQAP